MIYEYINYLYNLSLYKKIKLFFIIMIIFEIIVISIKSTNHIYSKIEYYKTARREIN